MLLTLRYVLRSLWPSRGFTIAVVLTLGLGIGANPAIVGVVRGVLLKPIPHQEGDRLMYLRQSADGQGASAVAFSVPETDRGLVTGTYLSVMGLRPILGRPFTDADDGAAAAHTSDSFTVATYNIRHGRGMDGQVDLTRTAAAIRALEADVIGLQEVDRNVQRSGAADQPRILGDALGLQHTFGAFFPYQGGEYGMAILSRFPIVRSEALRLPEGNEPRVALLAELALPSGRRVLAVNVHFDWVESDTFRFRQAEALAAVLDTVRLAIILLGDFNDHPGSRTLGLWRARFATLSKPANDRLTFSSTAPEKEIDHILLGPAPSWAQAGGRVVTDPLTSDHRAFVGRVTLH